MHMEDLQNIGNACQAWAILNGNKNRYIHKMVGAN